MYKTWKNRYRAKCISNVKLFIQRLDDQMKLSVKVIAGARQEKIVGWLSGDLKMKVAQPAERGKANQAVVRLLAKALGIHTQRITIVSGSTHSRKIIHVEGLSESDVAAKINAAISQ